MFCQGALHIPWTPWLDRCVLADAQYLGAADEPLGVLVVNISSLVVAAGTTSLFNHTGVMRIPTFRRTVELASNGTVKRIALLSNVRFAECMADIVLSETGHRQ
jgi:hypothetical protein